jgi:protein-disulfide isomerase
MFYPILKDFLSQNSDVRFVYRPTPFHEGGKVEEQAMDCANDQGKYWEYLDAIYTSTDTENVTDVARLKKIATDAGLNDTTFEQCFTSQKYAGNIDTYLNAARSAGISGTPTSILVGPKGAKELRGASSVDTLKTAVDSVR